MNNPDFYVTSKDLASKGKRFANYIIDIIIFYVAIMALSFVIVMIMGFIGGDVDGFLYSIENVNPILDRVLSMLMYGVYMIAIEFIF